MNDERPKLRVVKVGGSLLDWPPLPNALNQWLASEPLTFNVLLCGCGKLADVIRRADRDFSLGEEASHWLCTDLLSVTSRLLSTMLPELRRYDRFEELAAHLAKRDPANIIFDPREFLLAHEPSIAGPPLPHSWSVTTDSIAARLAQALAAEELLLLKSADAPAAASLAQLSAAGLVDAHFPCAATEIPVVRLINLRCVSAFPSPSPQP